MVSHVSSLAPKFAAIVNEGLSDLSNQGSDTGASRALQERIKVARCQTVQNHQLTHSRDRNVFGLRYGGKAAAFPKLLCPPPDSRHGCANLLSPR